MQDKPNPRRTRVGKTPGIYEGRGGRYEFNYRDSDGRLRWQVVDGGYRDAVEARRAMLSRMDKGERVAPSKTTFGEQFEVWIAEQRQLAPRTVEAYKWAKRHLSRFDRVKLADLTPKHFETLVADMQDAGYAGESIASVLTAASAMLRDAESEGKVAANVVRKMHRGRRPKMDRRERRILTSEEIGRLLEAAESFRPMVAVGLFGGLRLGEILGLRWSDVGGGFIRVRRQLNRQRGAVDLKTDESKRDVILVPELDRILKEHRWATPYQSDDDFVFSAPGGRGRDHRSTSRALERIVTRAGIGDEPPISWHSLRHSFASMLICGLKQDAVSVSRQLGHRNPTVTLTVYSHEFDKARSADKLRDAMSAGFGGLLEPVFPESVSHAPGEASATVLPLDGNRRVAGLSSDGR